MRIVGIDFGTTTSAVAVAENGEAVLLDDPSGRSLLPTVVYIPPTQQAVVGIAARNRLNLSPDRSFAGIKRLLGLNYQSEGAKSLAKLFGWTIHRGPNDAAAMNVDGHLWSAVDLAAEVFQTLKQIAATRLDMPRVHAVVTVPAGFNHAQRKALIDAAERGGIQVERLMNEPTAAAIAYGLGARVGSRIAVFDLGGGTFDFTILEVQNNSFEVLSTTADAMLGSSDIDGALVAYMADKLREEHGLVVPQDKMSRLLPAAERIKIELSSKSSASAAVAAKWVGTPSRAIYDVEVTRVALEQIARPLIAKCMSGVRKGLQAANLDIQDMDEVVLVGGGSLMPLVQQMNAEFFQKVPLHSIDPERVVAIGAARWAEQMGRTSSPNIGSAAKLLDRSATGLGVATVAGIVDYVIPPNARVPASGVRHFTTSVENQTKIRLEVYQGTERRIEDCHTIGELVLDGLAPRPRGETSVEVTFVLDADGLVTISAVDGASGVAQEAQLRSATH